MVFDFRISNAGHFRVVHHFDPFSSVPVLKLLLSEITYLSDANRLPIQVRKLRIRQTQNRD
jgi:hypothetical protein